MKNTFAAIKFWMDKILSIACAVLLTFMTVLVLIQVFSRYILNSPVAFTEELVRYSLIWTGFIGAAYAFSTREHMSRMVGKLRCIYQYSCALRRARISAAKVRASTLPSIRRRQSARVCSVTSYPSMREEAKAFSNACSRVIGAIYKTAFRFFIIYIR